MPTKSSSFGAAFLVTVAVVSGACSSTTIVEPYDGDAGLGFGGDAARAGSGSGSGSGSSGSGSGSGNEQDGSSSVFPVADAGSSGSHDAGSHTSSDGGFFPHPSDAGSSFDSGSAPLCPGPAPTKADLDAQGGWKAPRPIAPTACAPADIAKFESNFSTAATFTDLVAGLPTSCSQCILSQETDAQWQFIVTDATGSSGFFNYGACYAVAPGGNAACGQAVQYMGFCATASCNECSDPEFASCEQSTAVQQACGANFGAYVQSACGTDSATLQKLDAACGSAVDAVAVLCGNGLPDGGPLPD